MIKNSVFVFFSHYGSFSRSSNSSVTPAELHLESDRKPETTPGNVSNLTSLFNKHQPDCLCRSKAAVIVLTCEVSRCMSNIQKQPEPQARSCRKTEIVI